jgi:arginase
MRIGIMGVRSSAGARAIGQEDCPVALREAGLVEKLVDVGHEVIDFGDTEVFRFKPDSSNPTSRNKNLVIEVCKIVSKKVEEILRSGFLPVILGGDCTIAIGSAAGIANVFPKTGLIYLDDDTDLNTPETTPSGIFDGMVVSHIIGRGVKELAHLANHYPALREENVALFGFDPSSGFVDPPEIEFLKNSKVAQFPIGRVRKLGAESAAKRALQELASRVERIFVHFDVDFINGKEMPAKDLIHPDGLTFRDAQLALKVFAESEEFVGMEITEFNPKMDSYRCMASRLVDLLISILR